MKSRSKQHHFEIPEALRHDAHTLVEDAQALLDATSGVVDEKISAARERLSAALGNGRRTYASFQARAAEQAERMDETVREHPYQTALIALGVGAFIGVLMCRR